MSKALILGTAGLAFSAVSASAQYLAPGYGYAGAPLYNYAAPGYGYEGYGAPATAGTTIIIVTPGAPAYTAPYAAPSAVVSQPLYAYAPSYGYDYTSGWNGAYWARRNRW